ncbi:hypothetical protein FXO38_06000 [Capsicum annuum]|nr:hypothetical protein FXO38_06000 [Capsicum annuum]KAF3675239.1 hypothetical protein FXO37_05982 [Capsicum annuum]
MLKQRRHTIRIFNVKDGNGTCHSDIKGIYHLGDGIPHNCSVYIGAAERKILRNERKLDESKGDAVGRDLLDLLLDVMESETTKSEVKLTGNHIKALILLEEYQYRVTGINTSCVDPLNWYPKGLRSHPQLAEVEDDVEEPMHAILEKKTDKYTVVHCSKDTEEVVHCSKDTEEVEWNMLDFEKRNFDAGDYVDLIYRLGVEVDSIG